MSDHVIDPAVEQDSPATKQWVAPDFFEVAVKDVTASIFATSGNDGTFGFNNTGS